jgi:tetratricopeptide (TPR) repeat protein
VTRPTPQRPARPVRGHVPPTERYRAALSEGHIAAVRGRLDAALACYEEAASIAPDRSLPRTSAGLALARAGRHDEALAQFEAALRLVPHDEASRLGRAESLAALERWGDAASDFDSVADLREADGRLADALEVACRALELAESRLRRRQVEALVERLQGAEPDDRARAAVETALRILEPVPVVAPERDAGAPGEAATAGGGAGTMGEAAVQDAGPPAEVAEPQSTTEPGPSLEPQEPPFDVAAATVAAERALEAGDGTAAREGLLALATALGKSGRVDAALDACSRALAVAPDDVEVHLQLARLYAARGWIALATDKLDLLERLATLDEDGSAIEGIAEARGRLARSV